MSRAENRHHERRHKKKAMIMAKSYGDEEPSSRKVGIMATTKCACSCWMCNKPRKVFGRSFSEYRAAPKISNALQYAEDEIDAHGGIIDTVTDDDDGEDINP